MSVKIMHFFLVLFSACVLVGIQSQGLPWETNPESYRGLKHGFQLDTSPHHVHFVDRGKFIIEVSVS